MSDDLVNQLTLNFLISKQQLQKLNKKNKETADQTKLREMNEYSERITKLFNDLLVCQGPDDLLFEVKNTFDNFIEKTIYYFKTHDANKLLENERRDDIQEDIDYEKEEREIENGNYKEICDESEYDENDLSEQDEEQEEQDEQQDEEQEQQDEEQEEQDEQHEEQEESDKKEHNHNNNETIAHEPVIVKSKYKKSTSSVGVDDIQKLPVDWFQSVRQDYKKNQIIPRKKEPTIVGENIKYVKKKI